ncbi:MAG: S8 family serine peptidase [Candidatus Eisenbacteria bacterium]
MPRSYSLFCHSFAVAGPVVLLLALVMGHAAPADAAVRPGARAAQLEARLIAPAAGERLQENEVVFTFERARAADQSRLLLLPRAFDPSGWTSIPEMADLTVRDASRGVLTLAEAGVELSSESAWWWSVASRDAASGTWRFSPVRSFTATPRFSNRLAPSPYLMRGVVGQMSPGDLRAAREDALRAPLPGASPRDRAGLSAAMAIPRPRIRLAAGYDFDPSAQAPAVPAELSMARVRVEEGAEGLESYVVQFTDAPAAAEMRAIAEAGGAVFSYIPDQAYLVRSTRAARERIAHDGRTAWVGDWEPAYRLSPNADRGSLTASNFEALLFPDADLAATVLNLTALGANVAQTSDNGINKKVRFSARGDQLAALAGIAGVVWIEPQARLELHNDRAQWVVQTNTGAAGARRVWDMGIRGEGQILMTSDSGINVAHDQFRDPAVPLTTFGDYPTHRKVIAYKLGSSNPGVTFGDHSGASYHGTHTAGTIGGSDGPVGGLDARDGMAPNAKLYFMDISGTGLGNSVDPFADLNDLFLPSYVGNGAGAARISSHSWGSAAAGAYTLNSLEVDQFMWAHPDYYIAFSNGNSGSVGSVGSPATAKNSAGMGGTRNGTGANVIYSSTSKGPTADGRRKPTFAAPATGQTTGGVFSANGAGTTGYIGLSGTSMASPAGTGAVALIRQYLTEGWYPTGAKVPANGFSPSAALLKAMAINSAALNISGSINPDNNVGFGRITADSALFFVGDSRKLLLEDFTTGLGAGQYVEYQINVTDSLVPLKVSLCWTDFPGSPAVLTQLVNNLNLTVSKGANVYKGNVYVSGQSAQGGSHDVLNVEEAVHINFPFKGVWTVRVEAPAVPMGLQPFGLVITGGVGNGAGTIAMDRAEYGSSSTVQLQIIDTNASGPLSVLVTSPTEPGGETVSLNGANGVFNGSLVLAPTLATAANGVLSVSNGNLLTATYDDPSPVATLAATASVNFSTPVITNVRATSLGPTGTVVTWTTDRNSTSRVYYGTTTGLELGSVDSVGYATAHSVLLPNTAAAATYFYDVESVSLAGSSARDDLGGAHYRFTGKPSGDILLLMSDSNFGRIGAWTSALANNGYDHETWTGSLADAPPLGDLNSGLRSYRGVIWQCGPDDYPPVSDVQRAAIDSYMSGGGRMWIVGHDLGWGLADPASPAYSAARAAWVQSALHANYLADPLTWTTDFGYALDPISGPYPAPTGVAYTPFGSGQAGDEITINAGGGTGAYVWFNDDATPDNNVLRWTSNTNNGSAGTAAWGGQPSRIVSSFLEFTAMAPPYTSPSAVRDTILNRTLNWVFGRPRPTLALTSPNGGETITSSPAGISWTETVGPGQSAAARSIEYSADGGDSWTLVTASAGASPYSWDLAGVPNTTRARVRVVLTDNGAPSLRAADASAANFAINVSGGDLVGPVVVSGSIGANPNPVVRGTNMTLSASVSDALTGGGTVAAAEWSFGPAAASAGAGTPMTGTFGTTTVAVSLVIDTQYFVLGNQQLWVRGQDAAGNWGTASALTLLVNGTGTTDVAGGIPAVAFLGQNTPNPSAGPTTIAFGLPRGGTIELDVFDTQGRLVKRLAEGAFPAGVHQARWDGRDQSGSRLGAGLYFYRLVTPQGRFEKRMALLQ